MVSCCGVCGSLIMNGRCTNSKCGKGNQVAWAKECPKAFLDALSHGKSRLVTAVRSSRADDLGGPPVGMMSGNRERPNTGRKEHPVPEKVCTMTRMSEPGTEGFASWECSRCLERWDWPEDGHEQVSYCPSCGSRVIVRDTMLLPTGRKETK